MEGYLARAYQVACMTREQIVSIQAKETALGYPLANFNIQTLLGLPTIRDRFCLPDENEALAVHGRRLKNEIDVMRLTNTDYGFPSDSNLDAVHSFDWAVYTKKDDLPFMGSASGRSRKGRLEEEV